MACKIYTRDTDGIVEHVNRADQPSIERQEQVTLTAQATKSNHGTYQPSTAEYPKATAQMTQCHAIFLHVECNDAHPALATSKGRQNIRIFLVRLSIEAARQRVINPSLWVSVELADFHNRNGCPSDNAL